MTSRQLTARVILLAMGLGPAVATAQDGGFERVDNPFQQEYPYSVGEDLRPGVQIDGLKWYLVNISPRDPDDVRPGTPVKTIVRLGFDNTTDRNLKVIAVVLFEDAHGNGLDRVEIDDIRVPARESKVVREKVKLESDLLIATRKLYIFCEVQN